MPFEAPLHSQSVAVEWISVKQSDNYAYSDMNIRFYSWISLLHSSWSLRYLSFYLLQFVRFNSPCQLDQSAHTHTQPIHITFGVCALHCATWQLIEFGLLPAAVMWKENNLLLNCYMAAPVDFLSFAFALLLLGRSSFSLSLCPSSSRHPYSNQARRALCALAGTCRHV